MEKTVKTSTIAPALCISFLALTGQVAASDPLSGEGRNFCARLGAEMGLDEKKLAETGWEAKALNFGQRFLIGGTATTSVNVEPVEPATIEEYRRVAKMCQSEGKAAVCRLTGPANFRFGWKGTVITTPVLKDEVAVVTVKGITTTCQSGGAGPKE